MQSYLDDVEKTSEAMRDGYYPTADVASRDAEGLRGACRGRGGRRELRISENKLAASGSRRSCEFWEEDFPELRRSRPGRADSALTVVFATHAPSALTQSG